MVDINLKGKDEENPNDDAVTVKTKFQAYKKYIIGGSIAACVAILIIVLVAVLAKPDGYSEEMLESRVDCLPWLRDAYLKNIRYECGKLSYCQYKPVKDNKLYPACFYDRNKLKLKITNQEETKLGRSYWISGGLTNSVMKIDFEYLDTATLRFKVKFNSLKKKFLNIYKHVCVCKD